MWSHRKAYKFILQDNNISSILDFGTYNGFFVKFLRDRNINAYGYDFNKYCIETGIKNYNLDRYITSNINDITVEKYDCVTAFEVIEHLDNINDFITTIKNLLKKDGIIILSTPNNNMLWRPPLDSPPHHLSRFTSKSISKLLEVNNFKVLKIYEQMSIFDLFRNYFGVMFRNKNTNSLKGGDFKNLKTSNRLKTFLNSSKNIFHIIFYPFDIILYLLGFRYISQVIIAKKDQ
jgi:SAM-dependent methyltransferase